VTLHDGYARIVEPNLSAPCKAVCPHHVPAQAYVQKVAKGEFRDAFDLITGKNPLQDICGLVCSAPCEDVCTLGKVSRPVEIRAIKRFVLEYGRKQGWSEGSEAAEFNGHRVAVIGSGPAGLTCAVTLKKAGYDVTIFEREQELGGNLRYAIPNFRLDRQRLQQELDRILSYGMKVHFGKELGKDITLESLKESGYESVFIAIGAQKEMSYDVPGEDAKGVIKANGFLKLVSGQDPVDIGRSVIVIGDSYSALDAAQTARRLGAEKVTLASKGFKKRKRDLQKRLKESQEEGIRLLEDVTLKQVLHQDGRVTGVELVNPLGLSIHDECETLIIAGGLEVDWALDEKMLRKGLIEIDRKTGETSRTGIFAGGDATRPGDIVGAIAAGKRGAVSIDQYLRKEKATLTYTPDTAVVDINQVLKRAGYLKDSSRPPQTITMDANDRIHSFETYERVLTEEEAVAEASRCLNCGCGEGCQLCKTICSEFAIEIVAPDILRIDPNLCVACGMCVQRCPLNNIEMIRIDMPEE
jgi:NADPH-dependent glutamate synthase beta subunit-like oxidoreductase